MSLKSNTTDDTAHSAVCEDSGVCPIQRSAYQGATYNADLFEEVTEERFERREHRRVVQARHGKKTRRLSKGRSENWN